MISHQYMMNSTSTPSQQLRKHYQAKQIEPAQYISLIHARSSNKRASTSQKWEALRLRSPLSIMTELPQWPYLTPFKPQTPDQTPYQWSPQLLTSPVHCPTITPYCTSTKNFTVLFITFRVFSVTAESTKYNRCILVQHKAVLSQSSMNGLKLGSSDHVVSNSMNSWHIWLSLSLLAHSEIWAQNSGTW